MKLQVGADSERLLVAAFPPGDVDADSQIERLE